MYTARTDGRVGQWTGTTPTSSQTGYKLPNLLDNPLLMRMPLKRKQPESSTASPSTLDARRSTARPCANRISHRWRYKLGQTGVVNSAITRIQPSVAQLPAQSIAVDLPSRFNLQSGIPEAQSLRQPTSQPFRHPFSVLSRRRRRSSPVPSTESSPAVQFRARDAPTQRQPQAAPPWPSKRVHVQALQPSVSDAVVDAVIDAVVDAVAVDAAVKRSKPPPPSRLPSSEVALFGSDDAGRIARSEGDKTIARTPTPTTATTPATAGPRALRSPLDDDVLDKRVHSRGVIPHSGGEYMMPDSGGERLPEHTHNKQEGKVSAPNKVTYTAMARFVASLARVPPAQLRPVAPAPTDQTSPFRPAAPAIAPSPPSPPSPPSLRRRRCFASRPGTPPTCLACSEHNQPLAQSNPFLPSRHRSVAAVAVVAPLRHPRLVARYASFLAPTAPTPTTAARAFQHFRHSAFSDGDDAQRLRSVFLALMATRRWPRRVFSGIDASVSLHQTRRRAQTPTAPTTSSASAFNQSDTAPSKCKCKSCRFP
ncbi:hypothetical protein QBC39DRAFT_418383 [Podospora conica]|nr:hypothetical protein QBC39DRAFT_418383 [Schizothecium conicum]